jgi:hypothetical protein
MLVDGNDAIDKAMIKQKQCLCDIQYVYACEGQDKG